MADLYIETRVIAPDTITITLVRSDYIAISNIFRVCFEVFLALSSAAVGVVLSVPQISMMHWAFLGTVSVSALSFLIIYFLHSRKAKIGS